MEHKIGQHQQGHRFEDRNDPWNGRNIVAAFYTDKGGFAACVHRALGLGDRRDRLYCGPYYDVHARGDPSQDSACVI